MNATATLTQTAPADLSSVSNPPRAEVIDFARKMAETGEVTVTSPIHPGTFEHRIAVHDAEAPGYTVIFITVVDGVPETHSLDFDFGDNAARHLVHEDGNGVTLCDHNNRPLVAYRIG